MFENNIDVRLCDLVGDAVIEVPNKYFKPNAGLSGPIASTFISVGPELPISLHVNLSPKFDFHGADGLAVLLDRDDRTESSLENSRILRRQLLWIAKDDAEAEFAVRRLLRFDNRSGCAEDSLRAPWESSTPFRC